MSLHIPSRRALVTASSTTRSQLWFAVAADATASRRVQWPGLIQQGWPARLPLLPAATGGGAVGVRGLQTTGRRSIEWSRLFGRRRRPSGGGGEGSGGGGSDAATTGLTGDLTRASTRQALRERMTNPQLGASPLLAGELEQEAAADGDGGTKDGTGPARQRQRSAADRTEGSRSALGTSLLPEHLRRALDPDPRSRVRWERKMVVRHVGRLLAPAGRETVQERLARTERTLLHKSPPLPTSTKKLMHLARQIAGKTLDDALVQMRFSKKKMAREIIWHLEEARDMAIVQRGMGLGRPAAAADTATTATGTATPSPAAPITIQTKDGKWLSIADPTRMYVDQAWVGKGEWRSVTPEYRARGRRFARWSPSTFLSIVLKEEKTRIRLHNERLAKEERKKPWVHLPNRPVTAQRPYYSW